MSSNSIVENTKLGAELNFRTLQSTRSVPQYRKVYPANGGARTLTLSSAGASQPLLFNIPAECINMGESYLEYEYTVDAQAAGRYTWIYKDVHGEVDTVLYRDTGSMNIVEVRNAHLYQQITNRLNYSPHDLEFHDNLFGMVPTNAPLTDVKNVRFDGTYNSVAFKEPQQMAMITPVAANISAVQYKKIYLKDLVKDTYFGLAKNQILPIETYLELNFNNSAGRVGFSSLSAVNPNSTPLAFIGNINISEFSLNLCVEQNQELAKQLKAQISSGISIPIPWVKIHTLGGSSARSFVYNLPLDNKQHGHRLKRIIYAPICSATNAVASDVHQLYDHANILGARIDQYQTELDNQKMQRDIIVTNATNKQDDFMYHRKLLKNTLMYNQPIYNQNFVHVDSWDFGESNDQSGGGAIMVDGMLLDKPVTWTFNCLSCGGVGGALPATFTNTAIVLGQKMLAINSSSFVVA